tara:strand:+ start:1755 stop:2096 length:342 start_codon:yes stop_codon:yes gene_type:complete
MPTLPKSKQRSWIPVKEAQTRQYSNQSFYNSKGWRMTRKFYIKANPLCEICKRNNITKESQMVDHITPINNGGQKIDHNNLQALCNKCHNTKSAKEGVEYRSGIKKYIRKRSI